MNQNFDFPVEKLSAPIEYLNLDSRSCNMLKRVDIYKVSQIIIVGKSNVLSIRNIGDFLANRIFVAISEYLGVSEDELSTDEVKKMALLEEQKNPLNSLNMSITILDLPAGVILLLKDSGVVTVEQLIRLRTNKYENNEKFGKKESRKIDRALWYYLNRVGKVGVLSQENEVVSTIMPPVNDLSLVLQFLEINERAWLIVHLRAVQLLTLEEISVEIGGVTRERVRQIIDLVNEKVQSKLKLLLFFCDCIDDQAKLIRKKIKNNELTISTLASEFKLIISESNLVATDEALERLIAIVRLLVISDKPWARENFVEKRKELTFLVCVAEPAIEKNAKVHQILELEKKKNKKLTYKEIAYSVLSEAKRPLHWREIAEKAYKLNKRERFETRALYHVLLDHEELFVRVGQGTYELVEWGNKQVEPYPDIIASVLKREKQAIPIDSILAKVSLVRSVKQPSLIMYLDMHPRFYKSINNTYGLRGWLPPREKQNLRTPEWLIEDSKSIERVERARQRGYDIESIIAEDKLI